MFRILLDRVGLYIRQDFAELSANIRQGMSDNPAGYPAPGKENEIRPSPTSRYHSVQPDVHELHISMNKNVRLLQNMQFIQDSSDVHNKYLVKVTVPIVLGIF